ncbi:MAG: hypothetical protein ACP5HG_16305, partial [Anaerolineae bacterium]
LRQRLGIPDDAERVLVFTESSHWDPNWLYTADAYFDRFVRANLDTAILALREEPRRVYGVECIFFLRMYWDRCPGQRDAVRELVNAGRLRLTHSGVTTADTLLPSAEALLRDWLLGQAWLRANGMEVEPTLAYFTDSFGASPALPSLLRAAGFDRTAITRVDGMKGMGADLESGKHFPRPETSAELLLEKERTLDFVWRDANGAEVLCHWNAFSYGQGDMLAHRGIGRMYLINFALPAGSDRHVARRIGQYVDQLAPLSRTPYMLCPIGFDFVAPLPDLVALLDRYNRNHYPTTGVWTVNAGFDDYMALIEAHRDALPVVELDPNPYWTGFYTARPRLKERCHALVDDLLLAERLSLTAGDVAQAKAVAEELAEAWWAAVTSNHHDFITGTSPDEVVEEEQIPWLKAAAATVQTALYRLAPDAHDEAQAAVGAPVAATGDPPAWRLEDGTLSVETVHYVAVLDEAAGGALVALRPAGAWGTPLEAPSNDLVIYRDGGGLWRMGYEFRGGAWREQARASDARSELDVRELGGMVTVTSRTESDGETLVRRLWFTNDAPLIRCQVEGRAPEGHSVTVRLATDLAMDELVMDTPGGVVARPPTRYYEPTFWPMQTFVHLRDARQGHGLAVLQRLPGAVSVQPDGSVELAALRNATHEMVYGLIGLPATPAEGHVREPYAFDYALLLTKDGDWRENGLATLARTMRTEGPWADPERAELWRRVAADVSTDTRGVWVTAVKLASRGEGVIVRLYSPAVPASAVTVSAPSLRVRGAFLCDARERDLAPLPVVDGAVRLEMDGTIATVRLVV